MKDTIYRQDAIDAVSEACLELRGVFGRCEDALKNLPSAQPEASILTVTVSPDSEEIERIVRKIKDEPVIVLPSAQPKQRKGEWIDEGFYADGHGAHAFRCSECGGHIIEYDADPFCRWCGADMRGEL